MSARKPRQTRTEYLEAVLSSLRREEHGDIEVVFRPFDGWYLIGEPRHFGDNGDLLGSNWRDAEVAMREWLA